MIFGVLLIAVGTVLLAVNTFGMVLPFDIARIGWPMFVIAPGVALLVVGLLTDNDAGIGLSVAGGIVTVVGVILAYQSATDHWSSWAYAWALIAPTGVGAAMVLWGVFHGRMDVVRQGLGGVGLGLVIFIVGFGFFEGVLNIGDERGLAGLGRQALPVALILAGVLLVISRVLPDREPRRRFASWAPGTGPSAYGTHPPAAAPGPPPPSTASWQMPSAPPSPAGPPSDTTTFTPPNPDPFADRGERP